MDVVVFERPIPAAKKLTLSLPAERIGGAGRIALTIDASRVASAPAAAGDAK